MSLVQTHRQQIAQRLANRKKDFAYITPDPAARYEPFPLSDMQYAYWVGRDQAFDDSGAIQFYLEFRTAHDFDLERFEEAWNALIRQHDMLRAVVIDNGQQRVLQTVPDQRIQREDISKRHSGDQEIFLSEKRIRLQKETADLTQWPHSQLSFTQTQVDGSGHLHMKLDIWCTDGWSLQILFEDLAAFYADPQSIKPQTVLSFRDYMLAVRRFEDTAEWKTSFAWWQNRLKNFPAPPPLPTRRTGSSHALKSFVRFEDSLNPQQMNALRTQAALRGLTIPSVVLGAYAYVLGRWSGALHFTVNVPRFNRPNWHKDIPNLVGEFASFNLLEVHTRLDDTFERHAQNIQKQMWEDLEHQAVSGVRQLREYARYRGTMEVGAMPIVFTALPEHRPHSSGDLTHRLECVGELLHMVSRTPQVWVDCLYGEYKGALFYNWDAMEALFPQNLIRTMFEAFSVFLKRLAQDPEVWGQPLPLDLPHDQKRQRTIANDTNYPVMEETPLARFMSYAESHPHHVAVIDASGVCLDYAALALQAYSLAHQLQSKGVKQGDRLALALAKGWRQPAAALAAQILGCPYIPIDPSHPPARIADLLAISAPAMVITDRDLSDILGTYRVLIYDTMPTNSPTASMPIPAYDPDALFCIIFTSGTTGDPKGAMITIGGMSNALQFSERHFRITPEDRLLAVTGWHHDMSLFDSFGALTTGAAVVFPDPKRDIDPGHWLDLIANHKVTIWNSVPRFMEMLVGEAERRGVPFPSHLRQVILGGDWIPIGLPQRLRDRQPSLEVASVGGPTETTLWNITHNAFERPEECPSIPYGRPISNCRYYILDAALRECPDWMPGEMYCAGLGVSPGYWGDSELTAQKFILHPQSGERLYRTGDRGCYRPDGTIEFLGRSDFQINLGGYRADVVEIEKVITSCPGVEDSLVVVQKKEQGGGQLVAFYRTSESFSFPIDAVRSWCQKRLPAPLVPRRFQCVAHYPLNRNGKVDRSALAEYTLDSDLSSQRSALETPLEHFIASLWSEHLGASIADIHANYFELGGDSLKAMAIFLAIEETLGMRPPLSLIFTRPTVGTFVQGLLEIIAERTQSRIASFS